MGSAATITPLVRRSDVLRTARPKRIAQTVEDTAALLKALSDPTRLTMLALIERAAEPTCVCHIEARFRLSQPTISHHLKVLRESGLVTSERRGTWVHYGIDRERLGAVPGLTELVRSVALERGAPCCP